MAAMIKATFKDEIRHHLGEGLGVEDIALKLSCSVESVRYEVSRLRASRQLGWVLKVKGIDSENG